MRALLLDSPGKKFRMGDYRQPEFGLFPELPNTRQIGEQLSHEAHDLMAGLRQDVRDAPRLIADRLITQCGVLPATCVTGDDSVSSVVVQANLRERSGRIDAESPLGSFSFGCRQRETPPSPFSVPSLRDFSYEFNAQSADGRTNLRVWAPNAQQAPYVNFRANALENVSFTYVRDETQNRAGMQAAFPEFNLAASHDFRTNRFNLTGTTPREGGWNLGVNVDLGPQNYYSVGAQLQYGYGYSSRNR